MRLQANDLLTYCNAMNRKTEWKYTMNAEKSDYGYWRLELVDNTTWESERLISGLTLREAHEFLRGFYRGMEYTKIDN